jgi:hypothetical protein
MKREIIAKLKAVYEAKGRSGYVFVKDLFKNGDGATADSRKEEFLNSFLTVFNGRFKHRFESECNVQIQGKGKVRKQIRFNHAADVSTFSNNIFRDYNLSSNPADIAAENAVENAAENNGAGAAADDAIDGENSGAAAVGATAVAAVGAAGAVAAVAAGGAVGAVDAVVAAGVVAAVGRAGVAGGGAATDGASEGAAVASAAAVDAVGNAGATEAAAGGGAAGDNTAAAVGATNVYIKKCLL